jgi:hypothetical protein
MLAAALSAARVRPDAARARARASWFAPRSAAGHPPGRARSARPRFASPTPTRARPRRPRTCPPQDRQGFRASAELFESAREVAARAAPISEVLVGLERRPPLADRLLPAPGRVQDAREPVAAVRLEPDRSGFRRTEAALGRVEVLPALIVRGEQESDPGVPRPLRGAGADLRQDPRRLAALPLLQEIRGARELRVEVGGDRADRDVGSERRR